MKSKPGCLFFGTGLLLAGVLVACGLIGVGLLRQRQERAQWQYLPPIVQITTPQDGVSAPIGSYLPVASTIFFPPQNPVQTVEWWLDGTRLESRPLQAEMGDSQAYETYNLLVPAEGTHILLVRAINSLGVIGVSQPITFQGAAKGEAYFNVALAEGETLESLAAEYGTDAATLQTLNPGLGSAPAAGTTLKIPIPPDNEPPAPLPSLPPGSGVTLVSTAPMLQIASFSLGGVPGLLAATPPAAPASLQGEVKDCKVKLLWEDKADDESGYEVWMTAPGAPLKRMVTLQAAPGGVAWFEFQAPGPGYFLFWVEAVNLIGRRGSNIIFLNVDAGCPAGAATHLQVDILDISIRSDADRVYCYISFDNAPETRLPAGDGNFIRVQNGHGDLTTWPHTFALTIPQDNILNLSGECWGWAGQNLGKLGTFAASLGSETWNGASRLVQGGTFDVSLSVLPQSMDSTRATYSNNGGFPEPYNLRLEFQEATPAWPSHWMLYWDFEPPPGENWVFDDIYWTDPSDENNTWHVLRRNLPYPSLGTEVARGGRESLLQFIGCGKIVLFHVEALRVKPYGVETHGLLTYSLPPCPASLTVTFDTLELPWTGDGLAAGPCDELEVYYTLMVNEAKKSFWGGCSFGVGCFLKNLQCGTYSFKDLASPTNDPYPHQITVPIYTESVNLKISTFFYDQDDNPDDLFAPYALYHSWATRAQAEAELGCNGKSFVTDKYMNETADSILHYTISIYPNPCTPSHP